MSEQAISSLSVRVTRGGFVERILASRIGVSQDGRAVQHELVCDDQRGRMASCGCSSVPA